MFFREDILTNPASTALRNAPHVSARRQRGGEGLRSVTREVGNALLACSGGSLF